MTLVTIWAKHRLTILIFAAVTLLYAPLSPANTEGMGYIGEEVRTGNQVLGNIFHLNLNHAKAVPKIEWSRHGPLSVLIDLPFLAAGTVLENNSLVSQQLVLSIEPILLTALIVSLVFLWLCESTQDQFTSFMLALIAAFCTLLWPYAYIGLETKQSAFLMLSGYLALQSPRPHTWAKTIFFAVCCAVSISVKASGTFFIPAIALLIGVYFYRQRSTRYDRAWQWQAVAVVIVTFGVYWANSVVRAWYWDPLGGAAAFMRGWLVDGALEFIVNVFAIIGSPNKGLLIYSPVSILALLLLARAWKYDRLLVAFTVLVLGGLVGGFALMGAWSDETWGSRYLHASIGPLILCLGRGFSKSSSGQKLGLGVTALLGFAISFLGAFFYYGTLHGVATTTSQATLETIQSDLVWNHIRFNARLFSAWRMSGQVPVPWTPKHTWWFERPPNAPDWKSYDLSLVARPQSFLVRGWKTPKKGGYLMLWLGYLACLPIGLALLVYISILLSGAKNVILPAEMAASSSRGP